MIKEIKNQALTHQVELLQKVIAETEKSYLRNGYVPNIIHPHSLSEKLLHKKLFHKDLNMILLSDKLRVYEYLVKKLDKLKADEIWIKKLVITNNPEKIQWIKLPSDFIIKPNHASGWKQVIRNNDYDRQALIQKSKTWLQSYYGEKTNEWYYKEIKPQVFIEPFLLKDNGEPLLDYRFYMLNGEVGFIMVISRGPDNELLRSNYDENWNRLDVIIGGSRSVPIPKSNNLSQMLEIAKTLSKELDFVRVDFYDLGDTIKFSELTFFPTAGNLMLSPSSFDFELGNKLKLL